MSSAVTLSLPFEGLWMARNSPARRVPSHGTDLWGERYAIDFIGVDQRHRVASERDFGTLWGTEPPERFVGFGRDILAPADGIVVEAQDGEPDHVARRSQLALVPYMLGQRKRMQQGVTAIAGNYVTIALDGGAFVALVHLRSGWLRVAVGDRVADGQPIAACGNSGNSTQPHVHLQVMDSRDLSVARGIPLLFRRFREWPKGGKDAVVRTAAIPAEGAVVEPTTSTLP